MSLISKYDKPGEFISLFDSETGFYLRYGLHENEPFMAEFPELIDVGIMGTCELGSLGKCYTSGIQCYQQGLTVQKPDMTFVDFQTIVEQCKGKTFQFALGGRGDPNKHADFGAMLELCAGNQIVPNYTTSGYSLSDEQISLSKRFCGAVAVSWYRHGFTLDAINRLIEAGVKTNIHYVLSTNSIDEAIERVAQNGFPDGVNAVIFLLHKPVGLGTLDLVLQAEDNRVKQLFAEVDKAISESRLKVGFDSCSVPGILQFMNNTNLSSIEACEAARWSMYVAADMVASPCSFAQAEGIDLRVNSLKDAWISPLFKSVRDTFTHCDCDCQYKLDCLGGCPLFKQINLCDKYH
jgi:hypothetical protein